MSKNRKKERKEKESQGGASDQRIHLPVKATQETGVWSLSPEDPVE